MIRVLTLKPQLLLSLAAAFFVLLYILASSFLTSLGFKINSALETKRALAEQYEQALVNLAQFQDPKFLQESSVKLHLVEEVSLARYIDTRTSGVGLAENKPSQP